MESSVKVLPREIETSVSIVCCLGVRQYLRPMKLDRNAGKDCRMNMDRALASANFSLALFSMAATKGKAEIFATRKIHK